MEHFVLLILKNVQQKRSQKALDLLIQFVLPVFIFSMVLVVFAPPPPGNSPYYSRHVLNPFNSQSEIGVFNYQSAQGVYAAPGTMLYSPDSHSGVQQLIKHLGDSIPSGNDGWNFVGCADDAACQEYINKHFFSTVGLVSFNLTEAQKSSGTFIESEEIPSVIEYTISVGQTSSVNADYSFSNRDVVYNQVVANADTWAGAGFLTLQNLIDVYLGNLKSDDLLSIDAYVVRYPVNERDYQQNLTFDASYKRYFLWMWLAPVILTIGFYYPMQTFSAEAVREGDIKIHDLLEVSGISFFAYWASYVAMGLITGAIVLFFAIVLLHFPMEIITTLTLGAYSRVLLSFSLGIMTQCLALGRFFEKVEYFPLPVLLLQTVLSVAGTFVANSEELQPALKSFIGLLSPPIGLANAVWGIETFQRRNPGATSFDYGWVDRTAQVPSVSDSIAILLVGAVLSFLFVWGFPFSWLRMLTAGDSIVIEGDEADLQYPCDLEDDGNGEGGGDNGTNSRPVLLQSNNLTKIYPGTTRKAVNDLSFTVREGEILSFLGANGAGKSTTMAMLSGTTPPTRGDAIIGGKSVTLETSAAKRNVGVCFQTDVIWSDLTVGFHLWFFGKLRGLRGRALDNAVSEMLDSLGFPEKRGFLAGNLSGGQKRRLCVGLSMVGRNKVVYLDEPTAGLDPVSRRQLWDLIERNRMGRAILLTTHFMDEADILGDRVAIVKEGRLRACGSSKWLKEKFGIGYLLRCAVAIKKEAQEAEEVRRFIQSAVSAAVPEAELASSAGTELAFRLPREKSSKFPALFQQFDENPGVVTSYGIEATTLEEVFMEIVNEDVEHLAVVSKGAYEGRGSAATTDAVVASVDEGEVKAGATYVIRGKKKVDDASAFTDAEVTAMLRPGRAQTDDLLACPEFGTLRQIWPMLVKRTKQMTRSKGQFNFLITVPVLMAAVAALVIKGIATNILINPPPPAPLAPLFSSPNPVPISSGQGQAFVNDFASQTGFAATSGGGSGITYLDGGTLNSVLGFLVASSTASPDNGITSSDAVYLESFGGHSGGSTSTYTYNYTLYYNASDSLNFPAAVSKINEAAVLNATGGSVRISHGVGLLPGVAIQTQIYGSFLLVMVVGLLHASISSGICLVLGQEKVTLVKHQQLSSGARTLAYWVSNLVFDYLSFLAGACFLAVAFALSGNESYRSAESAFFVVGVGTVYALAATLQAHCVSFVSPDIRLLQSSVFYGTVMRLFIMNTVFMSVFLTGTNRNLATNLTARIILSVFGLVEPVFPFAYILLFQANLFGVVSQNDSTATAVAAPYLANLVFSAALYMLVLVYFEAGERLLRKISLFVRECGSGLKVSRADDRRESFSPDFYREGSGGTAAAGNPIVHPNGSSSMTSLQVGDNNEDLHSVDATNEGVDAKEVEGSEEPEDADVAVERRHVESLVAQGKISRRRHAVFLAGIRKVYVAPGPAGKKKVAVRGMHLSISQGEAFGLLGANGAGKSSLFKMMSGLEGITEGKAYINGIDVERSRSLAQRSMGLCPQFDTLILRMTVRENLLYFAKIKGLYSEEAAGPAVGLFMRAMDITRYQNMLVQQLSGGNRRKVSLIVALLGAPAALFLDEPSTGLDPVAARMMWNLLTRVRATSRVALILTTHNMLECEAVCNRVGIMSAGRMVGLGNCLHLRTVDGATYLLEICVSTAGDRSGGPDDDGAALPTSVSPMGARESASHEELTARVDGVKQFVSSTFPSASLLEDNVNQLTYQLHQSDVISLSKTFGVLEANKVRLRIREYNLSQASLEQTFLKKIRAGDAAALEDKDNAVDIRHKPRLGDYLCAVFFWFLSFIFPGALRFWLKDYANGVLFFCTYNEFVLGGVFDLFRLPELLELSISRYGHMGDGCCPGCLRFFFCCGCCCCCGCCGKAGGLHEQGVDEEAGKDLVVEDVSDARSDGPLADPAGRHGGGLNNNIRSDTIPVAI